jgi:hypothetical protein
MQVVSDARRLKSLEDENAKLKKLLAMLDKAMHGRHRKKMETLVGKPRRLNRELQRRAAIRKEGQIVIVAQMQSSNYHSKRTTT